jgi:hypothetical protein
MNSQEQQKNPLKTNKIPNIQEVTQKIAIHKKRKKTHHLGKFGGDKKHLCLSPKVHHLNILKSNIKNT